MPLTETAVRNAKPRAKPYKLADERGMYLHVMPGGGKLWRLKYRVAGKEKLLALGKHPDTTLRDARDKRDDARRLLANGIDPNEKRKAERGAFSGTFEAIAREWHTKFSTEWTEPHAQRILRRFEADVFPWIGSRPIATLTAPDILAALRRIESRGALQTAHRAYQNVGQVFRYAVATGRANLDPTPALRGAIPPVRKTHFASITDPERIGGLLRAIDGYQGHFITRTALQIAPLVFVRPGELRMAEWTEIDLEKSEWRIPAERMKAGEQHIVPLSKQAQAILRELHPLTGTSQYVFPSLRTNDRPMSNNTVNAALRRMGFDKETMTGHGFRSMASTLLNEQGWNRDAIERQLAHAQRDQIRASYNYAQYLPERRKMMQAWADYLDQLARGTKNVVAIKRRAN